MTSKTTVFGNADRGNEQIREILDSVLAALDAKGYHPINQLVGYLLSGDPAYITSYQNARHLITTVEREDLLEELLRQYLNRPRSQG